MGGGGGGKVQLQTEHGTRDLNMAQGVSRQPTRDKGAIHQGPGDTHYELGQGRAWLWQRKGVEWRAHEDIDDILGPGAERHSAE